MGRRAAKRDNGRASALGGSYSTAMRTIDTLCDNVVATTCQATFTRSEVVAQLFPSSVLKLLRDAAAVALHHGNSGAYDVHGANIRIDFGYDAKMLLPDAEQLLAQDPSSPLVVAIDAVRAVHMEFGAVKHVCHWLNVFATPNAIRYYWPTMAALIPGGIDTLPDGVPNRFTDVPGIAPALPLIKQAAASVAAAFLCPKAGNPKGILLTLPTEHVEFPEHLYRVEGRSYWIGLS